MNIATNHSVEEHQPDIFSFDTWVLGLEAVRQTGGYWSGIGTFGKESDACKNAYYEDEDGVEQNHVKDEYERQWEEISNEFVAYKSNNGESYSDGQDHTSRTLADEVKEAIHFSTEIMMMPHSPFVNAMYTWMMSHGDKPDAENPLKPKFYLDKDGKPLHQYGVRAKLLEGLGLDVLERSKHLGCEHPTSWGFEECEKDGVAKPKYRAKTAVGKWVDIDEKQVQDLLSSPNGPHVVMTANHAFLEDEKADLLSITGGVEELMQSSALQPISLDKRLELNSLRAEEAKLRIKAKKDPRNFKEAEEKLTALVEEKTQEYGGDVTNLNLKIKGIDEQPGKGDTVMVAAVYSRENNVLNLAHLFRRLEKINHHKERSEEDDLRDVSPASLMLASTILKTILNDPDQVRLVDAKHPELLKAGNGDARRAEPPKLLEGEQHQFHDDAAERIRHLAMVGFSQGGNVMRDALRYVVHEIHRVQVEPSKNSEASNTKAAARDILSALSVTAISLNEIAMNDFYTEYGVNCGIVSNLQESRYRGGFIAPPPAHHHSTSDPVITLDAFEGYHGHHPGKMFNAIVARGGHALSHFQCAFAPNVGKIALRYVRPTEDGLMFEVSGRSKEENIDPAFKALASALSEEGVDFTSIDEVPRSDIGRRQYVIKGNGLDQKEAITKIQGALMKVEESTMTVAQDVYAGLNAISRGKDVDETVQTQRIISNHMTLDPNKLKSGEDPNFKVLTENLETSKIALEQAGLGHKVRISL